jgi:hypothetical protein
VNVLAVGLNGNLFPPLHVVTELPGEAYSASPLVAKDGVQLAEEESWSRDGEKQVLRMTREVLRQSCGVDVDVHVVSRLGRLLKTLGWVAE